MSKFKLATIAEAIIIFLFFGLLCCLDAEKRVINHEENIVEYLKLLETEPNNCFYIEQLAGNYQALNNFELAIIYYKKSLDACSDTMSNHFQLGICYYLIMNKDLGIQQMDIAIKLAKKSGDKKMTGMLLSEKNAWLEKWSMVQELEWNKNKH